MSTATTPSGATVVSPKGYRAIVFKPGSTEPERDALMTTRLDLATQFVRSAAIDLGIGARGEVLGGERFKAVLHACRVVPNNAGNPKLVTEDV